MPSKAVKELMYVLRNTSDKNKIYSIASAIGSMYLSDDDYEYVVSEFTYIIRNTSNPDKIKACSAALSNIYNIKRYRRKELY